MAKSYARQVLVPRPNNAVPSGRVYVVKVGDVYIVRDPAIQDGEWGLAMVIDATGKILSRFAM